MNAPIVKSGHRAGRSDAATPCRWRRWLATDRFTESGGANYPPRSCSH